MVNPEDILKKHWGFDTFRPFQREALDAVIAGRDALVVLPTGGGKSLCYQLPAAMGLGRRSHGTFGEGGRGLVLVVSPLIALMDDQVAAAREAGLVADALHSNLENVDRGEAYRRLAGGETELLYVSPERLVVGDLMKDMAPRLLLVAVDEAHCVSHWGHEFRPEYRRLAEILERVPSAVRMALTATATHEVREDIVAQLPLRDPIRLIGYPDRPNLVYRAFPRYDQLDQVMEVVRRHPGHGGIVYAQTRKDVERLAAGLKKSGVSVAAYHAGLNAESRRRAQDDFVNERLDVVCATIAFGMGIDRSNVRFVVHANAPRSVEHYQQESGRAGRDGLEAECVLLFSASDFATHRWMAQRDGGLSPERQRVLDRQLREIGRFAGAPVCRHRVLAEHFGASYPPIETKTCGACDVCLGETRSLAEAEALVTAQKVLQGAWKANGRYGAGYVVNLLLGKADDRMKYNGHSTLEVFGVLKDAGERTVRAWVDQLIIQGFLEVSTEGEYPLLSITQTGRTLYQGGGTVRLGVPLPTTRKGKPAKKMKFVGTASPAEASMFERLRVLRRTLAERQGLPPYVIFHDTTLVEMAARQPRTLEALRTIKGVGDHKLERYGEAFLAVLNQ